MFNFMNTGLFVVSKDNRVTFLIPNVLRFLYSQIRVIFCGFVDIWRFNMWVLRIIGTLSCVNMDSSILYSWKLVLIRFFQMLKRGQALLGQYTTLKTMCSIFLNNWSFLLLKLDTFYFTKLNEWNTVCTCFFTKKKRSFLIKWSLFKNI